MPVLISLAPLVIGFCVDLILGDPHSIPHPVVLIGKLISGFEKLFRRLFPRTPRGEKLAGLALWLCVTALSWLVPAALLWLCRQISPWLALTLESVMCWQILATKSLRDESMKVFRALDSGDLTASRRAVSMIVGRDTQRLDEAGVARAAVETVAENASDGVIAPLIFLAIGGAPLGMVYKAVNTMDSMVGYKNDQYLWFGRCAAKLDDVVNFIPARLAGLLMCLGAGFSGFDGPNALRIFRRDRKNHKSPNSAHTEAAAAGALHIQLGGSNYYFGKLVEKPTIGDALRPVEVEDIRRANRLMFATAFLALLLVCILPLVLCLVC